jgi:N-acetylmuramoyl-L-alanine amidase
MMARAVIAALALVGAVGCTVPTVAQADRQQLECLRQNIYWEARNQSVRGQEAVAWVTLNRVWDARWPNTICDVVYQPAQFSWTLTKNDHTRPRANEQDAWERAHAIAQGVLIAHAQAKPDPTSRSVYFHTTDIRPSWASSKTPTVVLEDHIFYR